MLSEPLVTNRVPILQLLTLLRPPERGAENFQPNYNRT